VKAILIPHGPFHAIGPLVALVFSRLRAFRSAVVVGPDHAGLGLTLGIENQGRWATPLGTIEVDKKLASQIQKCVGGIKRDSELHADEHAIEVVLPFLQHAGFRSFVPLAVADNGDTEVAYRLGEGLASAIRKTKESVLLVASANLSRYESRSVVKENDSALLERICAMDAQGLMECVRVRRSSACGSMALASVVVGAKALGATMSDLVKYDTVGSGTLGSTSDEVVSGYAGVIFQ
jgi:hypothetical protein